MRSRALLDGGTQALLEGLRPMARWNAPVLEVNYPVERDLYLDGRGLLLVPSYFCWRLPPPWRTRVSIPYSSTRWRRHPSPSRTARTTGSNACWAAPAPPS
ncbi:hypothetical protein ACFQ51_02890 [Streptomyces kaempferi]